MSRRDTRGLTPRPELDTSSCQELETPFSIGAISMASLCSHGKVERVNCVLMYVGDVVYFTVSVRTYVHTAHSRSDTARLQGRHRLLSVSGLYQVVSFYG